MWGYAVSGRYMHERLTAIRQNLGRVMSNQSTLESGVPGQGCIK